jgi:diadenosine tetraphosphatase ApaH/serine/threonine PP2A family protein phosphatase
MKEVFGLIDRICFCGHSHFPGVYSQSDNQFRHPLQISHKYTFEDAKAIINVGSVGQPRDGDTRASYITFDDKGVEFHRVVYDNRATAQRIRGISGLPSYLADRLLSGT